MQGNAAEWVIDGYDVNFYAESAENLNPVSFPEQLYPRVVRGGSFKDGSNQLRAAAGAIQTKAGRGGTRKYPRASGGTPMHSMLASGS